MWPLLLLRGGELYAVIVWPLLVRGEFGAAGESGANGLGKGSEEDGMEQDVAVGGVRALILAYWVAMVSSLSCG